MFKKIFMITAFSVMSSSLLFSSQVNNDDAVPVDSDSVVVQNMITTGIFAGMSEKQADKQLKDNLKAERAAEKAAGQAAQSAEIQDRQQNDANFGVSLDFNS